MKQIKTYEGFFDFFKKVDLDKLTEECRKILSGESKEIKETKSEGRYEWKFSKSFEDKNLIFNVKLGTNALLRKSSSFSLHIQCEDPDDHPEEDIRNYIVDLEDALGDTIQLDKSYHMCGWKMQFHISRDSGNFDSTRSEIDEQIKMLEELLDGVNLSLVDLEKRESKLRTDMKHTSSQVYGQYHFLIKNK